VIGVFIISPANYLYAALSGMWGEQSGRVQCWTSWHQYQGVYKGRSVRQTASVLRRGGGGL